MEFLCSLVFINKRFCVRKRYKLPFKMFWNANPSNWYRLSVSNFHSSLFWHPISAVHPTLPAWHRTRATRSVSTWAWPECSRAIWGHGAVGGGRPKLLSAWDTWCSGTWGVGWVGSSAGLSGAGRCPKQGMRKEVPGKVRLNAACISLAVRIRPPSALTSSPTAVGGVCTYV